MAFSINNKKVYLKYYYINKFIYTINYLYTIYQYECCIIFNIELKRLDLGHLYAKILLDSVYNL